MTGLSADSHSSDHWYDHIPAIGNTGVETAKIGMWIFLGSEIMFFTGLIGSYIVLRLGADHWPKPEETLDIPLLGVNTFLLIVSSLTMVMALHSVQHDKKKQSVLYLSVTAFLGLCFVSIKVMDYFFMWNEVNEHHPEGFKITTSLFGSVYYTLTGFHGIHVLVGVVAIACLAIGAARGKFGSHRYAYIENIGLYWHFVDLIWIILFAILCLI